VVNLISVDQARPVLVIEGKRASLERRRSVLAGYRGQGGGLYSVIFFLRIITRIQSI